MRLREAIEAIENTKGKDPSAEFHQLTRWLKELLRRREAERAELRMKRLAEAVYLVPRS